MNIHLCRYCNKETYVTFIKSKFCYFCTGELPFKKRFSEYQCEMCEAKFASNRKRRFCNSCSNLPHTTQFDKYYYIKSKYNFTCQRCHKYIPKVNTRWRLHVHHKVPKLFGLDDGEENLKCLCSGCHAHIHRYPEKYPEFITIPKGVKWNKIWNIYREKDK